MLVNPVFLNFIRFTWEELLAYSFCVGH